MKLNILAEVVRIPEGEFHKGDTPEVNDVTAAYLIDMKYAEKFVESQTHKGNGKKK